MNTLHRRIGKLEGKSPNSLIFFFSADRTLSDADRKDVEAKFRLANGIPEAAGSFPIYADQGSSPSGEIMTGDEFSEWLDYIRKHGSRVGDAPMHAATSCCPCRVMAALMI